MEKKIETSIVFWGYIEIKEKKMEPTRMKGCLPSGCFIGIMLPAFWAECPGFWALDFKKVAEQKPVLWGPSAPKP